LFNPCLSVLGPCTLAHQTLAQFSIPTVLELECLRVALELERLCVAGGGPLLKLVDGLVLGGEDERLQLDGERQKHDAADAVGLQLLANLCNET
jgi:hypothetical protein